jgi:hypothetical protein
MFSPKTKTLLLPLQFGVNAHRYLKYFIIFTAWPVFNIGVSITLYLFYFLVREVNNRQRQRFLKIEFYSNKFYFFAFIALLSLIFAPYDRLITSLFDDVQMQIQYVYWILVSVFFMNIYKYVEQYEFGKYVFLGLLLHTIHFFFFNVHLPIPFVRTFVPRNGFVYTLLALWPIASGFVYSKYGKSKGNLSLFFVMFLMLLTDGRAGVVIILIENIFIYFIHNKSNAKVIRILLLTFVPLFASLGSEIATDENRNRLGNMASGISPRVGEFIKGEGAGGDLSFDKSWLTRRLMISKGFEIIQDYPLFGVGIGHFTDYQAELRDFRSSEFARLRGGVYDEYYYNKKSAHNSYIHLLSEMGIAGFGMLMLILIPILLHSIRKLYLLTITKDDLVLVSLIGICIHFYSISSLPGTVTWFIIGLAYARIFKTNSFKK